MTKKGRYFVGGLGVDSGTIFVGDPCYITGNKALCNDKLYEIMKDKTTPFICGLNHKTNPLEADLQYWYGQNGNAL